jgi:hypothetical protein
MRYNIFVAALLIAALTLLVPAAQADSFAEFHGVADFVQTTYGSGMQISKIEITVNTHDGMSWTVVCRRAYSNLGPCSTITQGEALIAKGWHSSYTVVEATSIQDKGFTLPPAKLPPNKIIPSGPPPAEDVQ